jgi:hypothetical protein
VQVFVLFLQLSIHLPHTRLLYSSHRAVDNAQIFVLSSTR